MAEYVSRLDDGDETKLRALGNTGTGGDGSSNGTFFRAVLSVRRGKVLCSNIKLVYAFVSTIIYVLLCFFYL